ncbi:hypothetical protein [Burkholderia vietnamiensis]|uniref:hypothetical protein n=1 Tax=Burkholderia vietnamiensis TaxID=60552 RepID=UPI001BA352A2|nr:hypothetical protein [Burkholderia vietnamiensis]MBR8030833.1 hypothetical protein [Burkholderia vietnamiensis]
MNEPMVEIGSPHIKPVNEGLYLTRMTRYGATMDCIWRDGKWRFKNNPETSCIFQNRQWIVLKEKHHG